MKPKPLFLLLAILTAFFGCQPRKITTIPDDLVGIWKTSAPKYADRSLEFTKETIIFGTGQGSVNIHPVVHVEQTPEGNSTFYTISHLNREGQQYTLSFSYDPANGGAISFKNQKTIVWRKERP